LKNLKSQELHPSEKLYTQTKQIIKMLSGYRKSTNEGNIIQAFKRSRIIVRLNNEYQNLIALVDKEHPKSVRH
jgi:hypothetical protein